MSLQVYIHSFLNHGLDRLNIRGIFSQPLNLSDYPFDRHEISIPIFSEYNKDELILLPDPQRPSYMSEKLTVTDWNIKNYHIKSGGENLADKNLNSRFAFSFEAVRNSEYIIIKFIIPLILIVAMSWIVFWINPGEIRSQFSISVTSVLTLIAYHIALVNRLPEIPYLTNMDIFIFGSTIIVFVSLLEVVRTSHLVNVGKMDQARKMDSVCKWLFPIAFAIIIAYSFFIR